MTQSALIGRSLPNVDGPALVTGKARFTVDINLPGMAHGKIVRSIHAHALIRSVDASRAEALDGVIMVITPDDVAHMPLVSLGPVADMPLLAQRKVRYSGEPVAVVIAESEAIAERGAELVTVEYEPLPHVLDPEEAAADGAPTIHDELDDVDGNVCYRLDTKVGDIEGAFASADHVLTERFVTTKAHAMPMETHAAVASYDEVSDVTTLWASTQGAHGLRDFVAYVLGVPNNKVRVIKPFVGGAFGHKEGLHTHEAMAVWASRAIGRPVRIVLARSEEFAATVSRNPHVRDVTIALSNRGEVLGWREKIIQDTGAYSGISTAVLCLSEWVTVGPYKTPALDIEGCVVYTNKPPSGAYRGFGNPQATFARELMFDIAARHLGLDPVEFRARNIIQAADLPTETANGLKLETLPIEEATEVTLRAIDYEGRRRSKAPFQGIGIANMLEWGGGCRVPGLDADIGSVTVEMHSDGSVVVSTDAADSGQGHRTVFTQIVADRLGVDPKAVRVVLADTDQSPYGFGTYGSRTLVIHGSALTRSCDKIADKLLAIAAQMLEVDPADLEIADGTIRVRGAGVSVAVSQVAALAHFHRASLPEGMEPTALMETSSYDTPSEIPDERGYGNFAANYTTSCTAVVVEVDPTTGKVDILDWASAEDVGRAINPDLIKGQLQGGVAQGIGYALGEDMIFDEMGTMLNPSMIDYQVPTAPEVPLVEDNLVSIESLDPTHPLQQKGIGESGITPAAAAIANAVYDAIGVPITTLPLSPEKVLRAIKSARA